MTGDHGIMVAGEGDVAAVRTGVGERLRMEDVRKSFGATVALDGVSLRVNAGEVLALVGENGAGKSTLMKVLSGAHVPDQGRMWLDGVPFAPRDPHDARRAGVRMVYQELSLAPHLSVMENIMLGMEPVLGPFVRWAEARRVAAGAMAKVGRPDIPLELPVARLSIADRQLVEIARSVAVGCKTLILDEPTSSLTTKDIASLFSLIRKLKSEGHAIIYISHFLDEVKEISDRFEVLRDGRSVGGGSTSSASENQIVSMMVGRDVKELYKRKARTIGAPLLALENVCGVVKPQGATLVLRRGEIVGLAGLVGAGRSELLRAIFGLDPVRSGRVGVGAVSGPFTPRGAWRAGMGLVSEDRKTEGLALPLSIMENMVLSNLPFITTATAQATAAAPWIEKLRIKCAGPSQPVGRLSGGNQQKVAIARLLHHGVDVLLLDEPTRGVDIGAKAHIYEVIEELAEQGKAILMVSSYLPELMGVCDRVAVMCRGILGEARPVGELTENKIMMEATGGAGEGGVGH